MVLIWVLSIPLCMKSIIKELYPGVLQYGKQAQADPLI